MSRRYETSRTVIASAALALVTAACGSPVPSTPAASAEPTASAPGQLHPIMEPAYDQAPLRLAYLVAGSRIEGETIDEDVEVIVNRPFPPGDIQVVYNDLVCNGSVAIVSNMEADALLDIEPDRCSVVTTDTHAPGAILHPELPHTASVGAFLPFGVPSVFVVRSLDTPGATPAAEVAVDDPPWEAEQVVVQPGRYEVSVLVDGVVLASDELDLERGEDRIVFLRVLPPDVPRDCGGLPEATCEPAITAAYAHGLFLQGDTTVSAVSVRTSEVMSCDMLITPEFDVINLDEADLHHDARLSG
jgi:hypothetical protein